VCVCCLVDSLLASAHHRFRTYTAGNVGPSNTSSRYNFTISALYPNGSFPSNADIQRYQISLWVSIGLVVIALSAVYSLAFMEFKKDTILYSSVCRRTGRGLRQELLYRLWWWYYCSDVVICSWSDCDGALARLLATWATLPELLSRSAVALQSYSRHIS
jgi:hypothetical protein